MKKLIIIFILPFFVLSQTTLNVSNGDGTFSLNTAVVSCNKFIDTDGDIDNVINEGFSLGYRIIMQEDITISQIGVPYVSGSFDNLSVSAFSKEILNWFKMGYN